MKYIILALFCTLFSCKECKVKVGDKYGGWQKGEMEIHHIATGRGESNFILFPDGTSMLIDAGDYHPADYPQKSAAKPDSSRLAGEWIARYIEKFNPYGKQVDYLLVSHFHDDHIGDMSVNDGISPEGNFVIAGINQVGQYIRFSKIIDRGYPSYNYPLQITDKNVDEYLKFIEWAKKKFNMQQEAFVVGENNQIRMVKDSSKYNNLFNIRNLCANAVLWAGEGESSISYYNANPQNIEGWQNENTMSIGLLISYGPFKYYTAGDLSGEVLDSNGKDIGIEERVAKLCGPVDVCKANHHGYLDAMTEGFVENIAASVYVLPIWDYYHINDVTMQRMASKELYSGERKIFATDIQDAIKTDFKEADWMDILAPEDGHIVVKVEKGGHKYWIYVLSNDNEEGIIKAIYGPYQSGKHSLQISDSQDLLTKWQ